MKKMRVECGRSFEHDYEVEGKKPANIADQILTDLMGIATIKKLAGKTVTLSCDGKTMPHKIHSNQDSQADSLSKAIRHVI